MTLKWILTLIPLTILFGLPFLTNIISMLIATLSIFFCVVMFLFLLNVEFVSIILILLIIGAFVVLIVFTVFILNQHIKVEHYINTSSWGFITVYCLIAGKIIIFFSSWDTIGITQLTLIHQLSERQSFLNMFDLSLFHSYGLMLLIIGLLLFLLTVGISLLLKSK